jgi:methyl-accepting chemotaxis protein
MTIKLKLTLLIACFVSLLIVNAIAINVWIESAEGQSTAINIAGRQRMLTQKATKEALLVAAGVTEQKSELSSTMNLFESSLDDFLTGAQKNGSSAFNGADLNKQFSKVRQAWNEYKKLQQAMESAPAEPAQLLALSKQSLEVLRESNEAVLLMEGQAKDSIANLSSLALLITLISIFTGCFSYFYLKRYVLTRIERLQSVSRQIAEDKDLRLRIGLAGQDELAAAARAFDLMLDGFASMNKEVMHVEHDLLKEVASLSEMAEQNKHSIEKQTGEIMQISASTNEMAATVQEIARNTQEAAGIAAKTNDSAQQGNRILQENMQLINALAMEILQSSDSIGRLAEASNAIGGIADTISTIAEQTNLLALNAAIEAARAGEQGRGFAVVADEVRSLAQKTQKATSQIHSLIVTLQQTTKDCVETMANSKARSESSVEHSQNLTGAIGSIISDVQELGDINHQIAVALEEQSSVAEEMSRNIVQIESQAQVAKSNAVKAAASSSELEQLAISLKAQLERFSV